MRAQRRYSKHDTETVALASEAMRRRQRMWRRYIRTKTACRALSYEGACHDLRNRRYASPV